MAKRRTYAEEPGSLFQLEVKLALVKAFFAPASGWQVSVHIDPMERANGGKHPPAKAARAAEAEAELRALGARVGTHDRYGKVDVVAEGPQGELRLIEVEGDSSKQAEESVYSCLGQVVVAMELVGPPTRYGIAVPNSARWLAQLSKIPTAVRELLSLDLYALRKGGGFMVAPREHVPRQLRT